MRDVAMVETHAPSGRGVVALIQAQVLLRPAMLDRWPLQDNGLDGGGQQVGVRDVGSGDDHGQWTTIGLDQQRALYAWLGAVGRVGPDAIPPIRALPIEVSAACQRQSQPSSSSHTSCTTAQTRSKMPRPTQRWKVRW